MEDEDYENLIKEIKKKRLNTKIKKILVLVESNKKQKEELKDMILRYESK